MSLKLNPKDSDTLTCRGLAYQKLGNLHQALSDYNQAIALLPDSYSAFVNRATVYAAMKNTKKALADFTHAITINPQEVSAYLNRGKYLETIGRLNDAEQDFRNAISINPHSAAAHTMLANLNGDRGRYEVASKEAEEALHADPKFWPAYKTRTVMDIQRGDNEQSAVDFDVMQGMASERSKSVPIISRSDIEKTISSYTRLLNLPHPDPDAYYNRAIVYIGANQLDRALDDLRSYAKGSTTGNTAATCRLLTWVVCRLNNDQAGARTAAAQSNEIKEMSAFVKALACYVAGKSTETLLFTAAKNIEAQTQAHYYVAINELTAGHKEKAIQDLKWVKEHGESKMDESFLANQELGRLNSQPRNGARSIQLAPAK
jgi:tetratricopeptide (TPR) repeat protein